MENIVDDKTKYDDMSKIMRNIYVDENFKSYMSFDSTYKNEIKLNYSSLLENIFDSVAKMTFEMPIKLILIYCDSFFLVKKLSKYRPNCRILTPTNNKNEYNFMRLFRAVTGILTKEESLLYTNDKLFKE